MNLAIKSTDLVVVETLKAAELFVPDGVERLLAKVTADVRALNSFDAATENGRTEIKSLAYKVARSKTALDDLGKEYVSELKRAASTIDADRRRIADAKAREDAETAKRESDKRHKAKINGEVLAAFRAVGLGEVTAKVATTALVQGKIVHAKITY